MVTLNHAIATAMVHGPAAGLERLAALDADPRLAGHHRLDAVRAHLLELSGDRDAAIAHYRRAAAHDEHARAQLPARESGTRVNPGTETREVTEETGVTEGLRGKIRSRCIMHWLARSAACALSHNNPR